MAVAAPAWAQGSFAPVVPGAATVLVHAADAEASSSGAALAVAVVAAAAAAAPGPAGYGRQVGGGSTPAGPTLNLRHRQLLWLRSLVSHRSNPCRRRRLQKKTMGVSSPNEPNNVRRLALQTSFTQTTPATSPRSPRSAEPRLAENCYSIFIKICQCMAVPNMCRCCCKLAPAPSAGVSLYH
jgi:hypothetical protein